MFTAPIVLGDKAAIITINAGTPDAVNDIVINAEGCECAYQDLYEEYCDPTEGGQYPNASIVDTEYTITNIPAGHSLVIDAVAREVKLLETGTTNQVGGLESLTFMGLFDWIEAARGGCVQICLDGSGAHTNPDTTIDIETFSKEL